MGHYQSGTCTILYFVSVRVVSVPGNNEPTHLGPSCHGGVPRLGGAAKVVVRVLHAERHMRQVVGLANDRLVRPGERSAI